MVVVIVLMVLMVYYHSVEAVLFMDMASHYENTADIRPVSILSIQLSVTV